jgi:hypothetical protein
MEPLGGEVERELRRFGPQAGMAALLEAWPGAVGAEIARFAWPARIARDGTLHVSTADAMWAFELAQRGPEIAERLGVPRVRFAPGPLPEPAEPPPEEGLATAAAPSPEDEELAAAIAATVGDEELRERIARAVSLGLARARSSRPF